MRDAFVVQGGEALKGDVQLSGAKNVALKVLIASLLFENAFTFENIPHIRDVEELVNLMSKLGVSAKFTRKDTLTVDPRGLSDHTVGFLHGCRIRTSFMLFAPLLYRFGKANLPNPGGCRLGARPIDRHIDMLKSFGVQVEYDSKSGYYRAKVKGTRISATKYRFDKPTHTGTELAIMIACLASGESVIQNAAREPEIDDLINLLNRAGAAIKKFDSEIHVKGVPKLQSIEEPYKIMYDRNEAPTYASFGLATRGDIVVRGVLQNEIKHFVDKVIEVGGGVENVDGGVRFYYKGELKCANVVTKPHPGFMTDWQGPWAVLMTQAYGESTIHETVFEQRFGYVEELKKLGAHIEFFQPNIKNGKRLYQFNVDGIDKGKLSQAIKIQGRTKLHNGVLNVSDLRAGATLLIAAAVAGGESVVNGASVIDRGYEDIDKKLRMLGAKIKRV